VDYPPTRAGRDHEQASRRLDVLLAFGVLVACSKDSGRQGIVAPNAPRPDGSIAASRSGGDDNDDADEDARIARRDDCDPRDPGWAPTGGCLLKRGDVSFAEFGAELSSPLSLSVVGHQAWRMDPSYLETVGAAVRVRNEGGRTHTFTRVAQFGGGKVPNPGLNKGLTTAPECPASVDIPPGGSMSLPTLAPGNYHFQCCIHPWMRALIKVKPHGEHGDG